MWIYNIAFHFVKETTTVHQYSLYSILDWFSANITLLFEDGTNHFLLLFAVVFIFWLGFMMISAIDPNKFLLLSFGIYPAIASSLDIELKYKPREGNERVDLLHSWKKYIFFVIRCGLAMMLIFFSILLLADTDVTSKTILMSFCYVAFTVLVLAKLFRYFWLVYQKNKHDCSIGHTNG